MQIKMQFCGSVVSAVFIILFCIFLGIFKGIIVIYSCLISQSFNLLLPIFSITRYLLEQDFPGMRIGPEPTTDSFIAVMYGESEGSVPGNALVVDPKKPFRKLSRFGNAFLNRWDLVVWYLLILSLSFYLIPLSSISIACQVFSAVFILSSVK